MKEQEGVVSFDVAKLADKLGFVFSKPSRTNSYFNHKGELNGDVVMELKYRNEEPNPYRSILAPRQEQLRKWLRETHNIYIELIIDGWGDDNCVEEDLPYRAFIWVSGQPRPHHADDLGCAKYEKILEVALFDALTLVDS